MSSLELETEVLLGKLDLALATGDFDNPKITQLELMRTPFYITCRSIESTRPSSGIKVSDLNTLRWALFERHVHPPLCDAILRTADIERTQAKSINHVITAEEAAQELYTDMADVSS